MMAPITIIIIIFTVLVSYTSLNNRMQFEKLKHYPYNEKRSKEYFRFLSGGFVHGDYIHLAVNMYVLYSIGSFVETLFTSEDFYGQYMGRIVFLGMYLLNIIAASIPTFLKHKDNPRFASVGASGAVSGLLFIFAAILPYEHFLLFFIIPMPAILFAVGYLIYSTYAARDTESRIDHTAHFYGALFGVAFLWITKPSMISHFFNKLINEFPYF
jgi:membrane associated rhomboid family serine protease